MGRGAGVVVQARQVRGGPRRGSTAHPGLADRRPTAALVGASIVASTRERRTPPRPTRTGARTAARPGSPTDTFDALPCREIILSPSGAHFCTFSFWVLRVSFHHRTVDWPPTTKSPFAATLPRRSLNDPASRALPCQRTLPGDDKTRGQRWRPGGARVEPRDRVRKGGSSRGRSGRNHVSFCTR